MALGPSSHPKLTHSSSLHIFSMKSPSSSSPSSSSSTLNSSKLKTVVQTFILSHLYRIARTLAKAKSLVIQVLKDIQILHFIEMSIKKNRNKNKLFLGSFRMHYNWCSSHVLPVPVPALEGYYDSTWNTVISTDFEEIEESELEEYLHWLEQKAQEEDSNNSSTQGHATTDIDRLADLFIANCHEKFKLEKQESYRRFQEMMARSV